MKQQPTVLCYNLSSDRFRRIRLIAMRQRIRLRTVKKEEYGRTIASLLDMEEASEALYEGDGFDDEMLVLAHFPSALVNSFLNAFRQARVPAVRLKCVLTESNRKWDSIFLHKDLTDEATYFDAARKEAQKRLKSGDFKPLHEQQKDNEG